MWFAYNFLFTLGYALMLPKFLLHMRRRGGYRKDFWQRLGRYAPDVGTALAERRRIWIHAVSVGEVLIAKQFMRAWRERHGEAAFVLSTTSSTGHRTAEGIVGQGDVLIYYPADFPMVVRRALDLIRPAALILAEGEVWPNMLRLCAERGIPAAIINARMSLRSHRRYRSVDQQTREPHLGGSLGRGLALHRRRRTLSGGPRPRLVQWRCRKGRDR